MSIENGNLSMFSLGNGRFEGISHSLERVKNHISFEKVFLFTLFHKAT